MHKTRTTLLATVATLAAGLLGVTSPADAAVGRATVISTGAGFSCGIYSGAVKCWGSNHGGTLGDGSGSTTSSTPVAVVGLGSGVTDISLGLTHACAIQAGVTKCWGRNGSGQLGNGTTTASPVPVTVIGLSTAATRVAAGYYHTCVIDGGAAKCWGDNGVGQLGNSSFTSSLTPVGVTGLGTNVTRIAAAEQHSCAVQAGTAKCWGANGFGQLGRGFAGAPTAVAATVSGLSSGVNEIDVGLEHSCAVQGTSAKCWGRNVSGQIGDGTTTSSSSPKPVIGMSSGVSAITAGSAGTCAVRLGIAYCWGVNVDGRLGDGTTIDRLAPVAVTGLPSTSVISISSLLGHGCTSQKTGTMCWGRNLYGELGNGTTVDSLVPVVVV